MAEERDHLLALPVEGFDLAEISFPIVDGGGCVRIRTNTYSTPVRARDPGAGESLSGPSGSLA